MSEHFRLELTLSADLAEEASAFLFDEAPQGWEERDGGEVIVYMAYFTDADLAEHVAQAAHQRWPGRVVKRVEEVKDRDWSHAWRDFFDPVVSGDFEVLPPWLADGADADKKSIIIEPAMAFGTGHHASTALCLRAITDLSHEGALPSETHFLDLGTGSAILAIGLAQLGLRGLGVDIDPQAVQNARENVALNRFEDMIELRDGSLDALKPDETYGFIVANILSGPLISMAEGIVQRLDRSKPGGGRLVLAGLLDSQKDDVAAAYVAQGMPQPRVLAMGEWICLRFDP